MKSALSSLQDWKNKHIPSRNDEDTLGNIAKNHDIAPLVSNKMERIHKLAWIVAGVEFAMIALLVTTIAKLVPLYHVEPMLVTFSDKEKQIVHIEPIEKSIPGYELMAEKMLMEYITIRNEVLLEENEIMRRWNRGGYMEIHSTAEGYKQFTTLVKGVYESAEEVGITRKVEIDSIKLLNSGEAKALYETIDSNQSGQVINRQNWLATIRFGFMPNKVSYDDRYKNPLGFKVHSFLPARR